MRQITSIFLLSAAFIICAHAAPVPTITLLPASGNVAGPPGSVVGWGFTFTYNAPADWAILTGSEFTGSPVYGTYVDYLSQATAPLYVAGPPPESATVQQAWNPSATPPLGVGEFDINSTAAVGAQIAGDITVHYAVFSQDPKSLDFDPSSVVVPDATISIPADVTVSPEPATFWMMSAALLPLALLSRRHRQA